ncbi:phage portal protein (minor capsid protein) [Escherichia coli]|nr:phage portal protein (minor capsid protein) [Escherichia coli]
MAIDGLKRSSGSGDADRSRTEHLRERVRETRDDYQEIFAQQVRETMERRAAGLKPPAWAAAAFESGLRQINRGGEE